MATAYRHGLIGMAATLALGLAGCASTGGNLPLGGQFDELEQSGMQQPTLYCRPGSAIIYKTSFSKVIPPARSFDGGSCM